jgi:hypothetical protein
MTNQSPAHPNFGKLPQWQRDLLRHTKIYPENRHLLATAETVVVTDGGIHQGKGYFGVTLAVGKIIIARV